MVNRREFAGIALLALPSRSRAAQRFRALQPALDAMEAANGGRLGVAVLDTGTGAQFSHRGGERFAMCSTFKVLLVSAVLRRVDRRQERLDRALTIPGKPLLSNSPLTEPRAGGRMTLAELCHSTITRSDNTAANLLLDTIGGPAGITKFARSIGDQVTRLDRTELALNEALDGDPRDTTSPVAMAADLQSILLGKVLSASSQDRLTQWMEANLTGLDRLRAKLPKDWRVADKTGSNGSHTSNDIAVIWPESKPPLIVTAYITQCQGPETKRAAMLQEIGRLVWQAVSPGN